MASNTVTPPSTAMPPSKLAQQQQQQQVQASLLLPPNASLRLDPKAPISDCPGRLLPAYRFSAPDAPSPGVKVQRVRRVSSGDSLSLVPDADTADVEGPRLSRSGSSSVDLLMLGAPSSPATSDPSALVPSPLGGDGEGEGGSLLDLALTALWDDAVGRGLFRYDLSSTSTKLVDGRLHFVAQLNEGRATKKRATECRPDAVVQPFDNCKFNFKKAAVQEVVFQFEAAPPGGGPSLEDASVCSSSPHLVLINVSPIEYGHVLLVPRVMDCLPQLVDPSTLELALAFASESSSPKLRVGYNSLGAYATINHLHYQAYYLDHPFPCELVPTEAVQGLKRRRDGISIRRLTRYPVNAFVVEVDAAVHASSTTEERAVLRSEVAALVGSACMRLAAINQPHNLLITDQGRRVFLFPQCFAENLSLGVVPEELVDTGVNPAAFEIGGHMLLKRQQDYDSLSEADMCRLLSYASLPEQRFMEVARLCFGSKQQQ